MRGAGDHLSIGERIAFYRVRRGLTQSVLANLVGRSEDWLSKIERGEREMRRLDVLTDVARALRVTLGDLVGQPVLVEDAHRDDDVPAIRDALMSPKRLSRVLFAHEGRRPNIDQVERLTASAWDSYQAGELGKAIAELPQLIAAAQSLEGDRDGRDGWCLSARVHHLAATTLSKVGEVDLAWIAAERAMGAADESDDPLMLASAARAGTHALLALGWFNDALQLGETARSWLADRVEVGDPDALSLLGMLDLRMAIAAARRQDRPTATRLLDRAERAACSSESMRTIGRRRSGRPMSPCTECRPHSTLVSRPTSQNTALASTRRRCRWNDRFHTTWMSLVRSATWHKTTLPWRCCSTPNDKRRNSSATVSRSAR